MALGDRRKNTRGLNTRSVTEDTDREAEELVQTLLELNSAVCDISKMIRQLQRNIVKETVHYADAIPEKTLH